MSNVKPTNLIELTETDPMRREVNKGLMVLWINADLLNRCSHDVRKSYVYYDDAKVFTLATYNELSEIGRKALFDAGIKYWSKGIV